MQSKTRQSVIRPVFVYGGFLSLVLTLCAGGAAKIEPTGTNVGAVQFDAVIEMNGYSSRSLRHDYTLIFARYWIARDYYCAAVVWFEPQSTDLFFTVNPVSLSVTSTQETFKVRHESIKEYNETYEKPLAERDVFRYKFASYPIENIRFAEREALATRIYAADLQSLKDEEKSGDEVFDVSIPAAKRPDASGVAQLKVRANRGRIDSMELFDATRQLLKSISYEYESNACKSYLHRQTVTLPERPIMVGFKGEGMKVTLDGKEYRYRDLEAKHHADERKCTVEYEPVMLGDKKIALPVQVTVRAGDDKRTLRSVHLTNFKKVELDAGGAEEASRQFGAVTPEQRQYEQLRLKYWMKAPSEIESQDVKIIGQLRDGFEKALGGPGKTTGEKLKALNILMELNVMLGDRTELDRQYRRYLSTLAENKLLWMSLVGGYAVIETSMFRGRPSEAAMLLDRWVDAVLDMHDGESILLFARRQLAKKRFWTTARLLEGASVKKLPTAGAQFEAEALRSTTLHELDKLMLNPDAIKGLSAETEADWVRSRTGPGGPEKMLVDSLAQANRSFDRLAEPTEFQRTLKRQLDQIDKEMSVPAK